MGRGLICTTNGKRGSIRSSFADESAIICVAMLREQRTRDLPLHGWRLGWIGFRPDGWIDSSSMEFLVYSIQNLERALSISVMRIELPDSFSRKRESKLGVLASCRILL